MSFLKLKVLLPALFTITLCFNSIEAVWSPSTVISQLAQDSRMQLSASAEDTTVVVWLTYDSGTNSDAIYSATYSGGVWSLPVLVSSLVEKVFDPVLVVDSNNVFILIWGAQVIPSGSKILAAQMPIGGPWTAPATIYTETTESIMFSTIQATTNDVGETIVTWITFDGGSSNFLVNSSTNSPS